MPYPVDIHIERPQVFQRAHVFLRVALLIVIGWIADPIGLLWLGPGVDGSSPSEGRRLFRRLPQRWPMAESRSARPRRRAGTSARRA